MKCADAVVVIAKIVSCGASRETCYDDEFSFWFSIETSKGRRYFQVPTPLIDGGYTQYQLETIEAELIFFDIDLLPLDSNLVH